VENDQGRVVRLNLRASSRDALGSATPILQYEAFRRIDPLTKEMGHVSLPKDTGTQLSDPGKLAGWEFVGAVPAHGYDEYNMIVPTLGGKTDEDTHWSVFFVRAATAEPLVFFDSCQNTGYSEDNLSPCVPKSLSVAYAAAGNQLSWEPSPEEDFRNFKIYRGSTPDFEPQAEDLIETTIGTQWLETGSDSWNYYYKISAVDLAGNESEAGAPVHVTGAGNGELPARTALHGAVPNPFNPSTTLKFELATAGHARLRVYDTAGRLVATLVDESRAAGHHEDVWDGRDAVGRMCSAGVYLYRLEYGEYSETKSMVLVK